jgi:hypothetical protein
MTEFVDLPELPSGSRDEAGLGATVPLTPRLQLRWEDGLAERDIFFGKGEPVWLCHYELVLPLREHDCRREVWKDGEEVGSVEELVVAMKSPTLRGKNGTTPCIGSHDSGKLYFDSPFRDGAHAKWDAPLLGGLPIYCVAPDGRFVEQPVEVHNLGAEGAQ